tara:strand:+ start:4008 stop:4904 length:897 start_codon:yes stop_codon:yes gene_type:complete
MLLQINKKPSWLKVKLPHGEQYQKVKKLIKTNHLNTICEEAKCPNLAECWSHGTATFLILGEICTRWCSYCHVKTGKPNSLDLKEPIKVAQAVKNLNLKYVVITSVTRDDLPDGGASIYKDTVNEIKKITNCSIELLIPDFKTKSNDTINKITLNLNSLKTVLESKPNVLAHNIEAVRRIFKQVRKQGDYDTSLLLLKKSKEINPNIPTKSSIILGLGETKEEIILTMKDLINNQVDFLTLGQYLKPSIKHTEIKKYYTPQEFDELKQEALNLGFKHVESGPLVRSSYRADKLNPLIK